MTLATLGWAVVWSTLGLARMGVAVPLAWVYGAACPLGAVGFGYGFLTIRARRAWLLMALIALFANGTLLLLPFALDAELRAALSAR